MIVNIDSDIVQSKFDSVRQMNVYTVKRGERRWTVEIPLSELHKFAGNKTARRGIVERYCNSAMNGPADGEK